MAIRSPNEVRICAMYIYWQMLPERLCIQVLPMTWKSGGVYMYLSIGNDMAVRDTSIIGIFDLDNTTYSKKTVEFLNNAEKEGAVIPCDDLPKSFVLTSEYGLNKVHLTSLNAYTLEKRLK